MSGEHGDGMRDADLKAKVTMSRRLSWQQREQEREAAEALANQRRLRDEFRERDARRRAA